MWRLRFNKQRVLTLILFILYFASLDAAKARKGKRKRNRNFNAGRSYRTALWVVVLGLIAVFLPVTCRFLYSVYYDPATPGVFSSLWKMVQEKAFGFLGGGQKRKRKKKKRGEELLSFPQDGESSYTDAPDMVYVEKDD